MTSVPLDQDPGPDAARIANLREKINNEDYIAGAIQRIAQVLSNEIMDIPQGGMYEQRKGRD
jgi:hypothetical protein